MRGSKKNYSSKQKRMAHHIEDSAKGSGKSNKRAEQIGWATVNKKSGGASGRSSASHSHRSQSRRSA
jgi:hypothetical protein